MAYQQKYYFNFVSLNGHANRVELWQDTTATLTAIEVDTMAMPFSIELPGIKDKFQTVRGTGCEINLLSATSFQFFTGLYHVNKMEFLIKHYIDGVINWLGFLDTELSRESYSYATNYPVQVTGNDGFAILDRIQFLQGVTDASPGAYYTGIKSLFEILTIIVNRIAGLPIAQIQISLSTTSPAVTIGSTETILHQTFIDTANFIKEDGTAETMRKVLEAILMPFGAIIFQDKGNIRITDINSMAAASAITSKVYTLQWVLVGAFYQYQWNYYSTITENPATTISAVGYMGTGQEIEISGGKNKQVVSYSPYPYSQIINTSIVNQTEFQFIGLSFILSTTNIFANGAYRIIFYKSISGNSTWSGSFQIARLWTDIIFYYANLYTLQTSNPIGGYGVTYHTNDTGLNYRWNGYSYQQTALTDYGSSQTVYAILDTSTTAIALSLRNNVFVVMPQTKSVPSIYGKSIVDGSGLLIKGLFIPMYYSNISASSFTIRLRLRIGANYYNGIDWSSTVDTSFGVRMTQSKDEQYSSDSNYDNDGKFKQYTLGIGGNDGILIPINQDLSGKLYLDFYNDFIADDTPGLYVGKLFLSELSVNISQLDSSTIPNSNIEYISYLDPSFKDENAKVELICGTESALADRGKMLYFNSADSIYRPIKSWTRNSQTDCIETLLLNSYSSNYQSGYITLNNVKLANKINQFNVLTDSFTGSKVLMASALKTNYRDNVVECTLVEITPDSLTIV